MVIMMFQYRFTVAQEIDFSGGVLIVDKVLYVCMEEWVWGHQPSCSVCCKPKTTLENKIYENFENHTHLSIPKSLSTIKFHDVMTCYQYILTLERTILFNYQHLVLFVSLMTGNVCKQNLLGCRKENGTKAEEKLDSTLICFPKLITSENLIDFVYLGTLCDTLKKTQLFLLNTSQG